MTREKPLYDEYGIIREAWKILPPEFRDKFLEALSELEDNECHRQRNFPKTQLHRVTNSQEAVYRAYIDKISGWRLHIMYGDDGAVHLKYIITPDKHDTVLKVIKSKKYRYQKSQVEEVKNKKQKKKRKNK